ncbi:MAG: 30S ribosomal protein S6 [Candidatus Doudnabacteria bacterium]|nr:30S ribosomal protein S6 [Candidatus Doudnabacteria bacterium]
MPKYELMYILSSAVSDDTVPAVSAEIDKSIIDLGGNLISTQALGKKKLAYPIKKTRNGFYILSTFLASGAKVKNLDAKIRSLDSVIRYIIINLEELEKRREKDQKIHEKMRASRKAMPAPAEPKSEVKITDTELEQKIEAALGSEDLTK